MLNASAFSRITFAFRRFFDDAKEMCFLPRLVAWLAALLVLSALDVQHSAAGHACIHGSRKERVRISSVRRVTEKIFCS